MGMFKARQQGYAAVEIVLIVVIVALIGGIGVWIYKQNNKQVVAPAADSSNGTTQAAAGTSEGVDQVSQSDAQDEAAINKKYDNSEQSTATSSNTALNNVGNSYDESNF